MFMFTSNTPTHRAENKHLKKAFGLLGCDVPTSEELLNNYLPDAKARVAEGTLQGLRGKKVAAATDGRSKRFAQRGTPLITVTFLPESGA